VDLRDAKCEIFSGFVFLCLESIEDILCTL